MKTTHNHLSLNQLFAIPIIGAGGLASGAPLLLLCWDTAHARAFAQGLVVTAQTALTLAAYCLGRWYDLLAILS